MSSDTVQSCRLGAFPLFEAKRALFERLSREISADDPAPWFVPPADEVERWARGDANAYARGLKLAHLTGLTLTHAFISGDLEGHASDGKEAFDMPRWFWAEAWTGNGTRFPTRVNVGPLMPDEWQRWNNERLFTDRAAFERWMAALDFQRLVHFQPLPTPNDAATKPEPVRFRPLPDRPFVTLSEALSWAAFSIALDWSKLHHVLEEQSVSDARQRLAEALSRLTEAGSAGDLEFRGKKVANYGEDARKAETVMITPLELDDFKRFNVLHDGLAVGTGIMWFDGDEPLAHALEGGNRREYRAVTVRRKQVLACFPEPHSVAEVLAQPLAQARNTSGADHAPRMTGRPNRRNEAIALHNRRLAANIALSNNSAEARAIHGELAALHNGDADWRYDPRSIERALREWRKNEGG